MMRTATRPAVDADAGIETPSSPLLRYARWQLRDFVTQRATVLLLVAVLMMYPLVAGFYNVSPGLEQFAAQARQGWIYVILGVITFLGTLLSVRGIVAEDRQQGYHRFLFSKPIDVAAFYAQSMAVQGIGLFGVIGLVAAIYAITVAPVSVVAVSVTALTFYVLFGGVTFLFSTLSRLDWIWTLGAVAASLWTNYLVDARGHTWLAPLSWLLPPLRDFGIMVNEFMRAVSEYGGSYLTAIAAGAWPVLYGAIAFGAGIWVLKKRSVAR